MTKFMCSICKYTLESEAPPEKCPSCSNSCSFVDATCYTPECGCENNIDTKIFESNKPQK
ncbi:MAG: rubredoxin-like domain-containing protein [Bacillota bacterium]|jgi:rubredoxin